MNYLGIDYGSSHLGLAFADGILAIPLKTISTKTALQELPQILSEHKIDAIIVGIPEGPIQSKASDFIAQLKIQFPEIEIISQDETLSSYDAVESLKHTTPSRRAQLEHQAAAAIILQSYLDSIQAK